jgi:hypothetical protein
MNIDPELLDMIAKYVGVNAVATLLLAVLSYFGSGWMLEGLAWVDRRLDPARRWRKGSPVLEKTPDK